MIVLTFFLQLSHNSSMIVWVKKKIDHKNDCVIQYLFDRLGAIKFTGIEIFYHFMALKFIGAIFFFWPFGQHVTVAAMCINCVFICKILHSFFHFISLFVIGSSHINFIYYYQVDPNQFNLNYLQSQQPQQPLSNGNSFENIE